MTSLAVALSHWHELLGGGEVSEERSIVPSRRHTGYTTHWASVVAVARGFLANVKPRNEITLCTQRACIAVASER